MVAEHGAHVQQRETTDVVDGNDVLQPAAFLKLCHARHQTALTDAALQITVKIYMYMYT